MDRLLDQLDADVSALVVPPPRIDLAAWIESHVVLPEGMTSSPGKVRLWPYQRGICDAISDPDVERITVVKSARLGYTTLLTGMIASYVANDPAQILVVLPTDDDCRDYVVSDIEPVFAASPALAGKLSDDADPAGRNTILSRRFPGGSIKLVGAKSPRKLRRHSARVLIIDEAAAMEADSGEGSVISRAITRTMGFADRKIIEGSTLTDDNSNVLLSYAGSSRARFEVPCPACGSFTYIEWRHIEWQADRPETAAFRCPHCRGLVDERHKPTMVTAGRWIAQNPRITAHAGFLINALVSPLPKASWAVLAAEFLASRDDPDQLKVFVNTVLAEPWTGDRAEVDDDALLASRESFGLNARLVDGTPLPIPPEVLAITAGIDVQDDRLEASVVGWSPAGPLVLDHLVFWGSPGGDEAWRSLDELLRTSWLHPCGEAMKIEAAAVDSGDGDWTQRVYDFCFPRASRRVLATKGMSGTRPAIAAGSKLAGGRPFIVGVDNLKSGIMSRLGRTGSIRFSAVLEPVYFEQLTAERRVVRHVRGQPRRTWERRAGARNEALDCLVYAFAAFHHLRPNLDHRRAVMTGHASPAPSHPASPRQQAEADRARARGQAPTQPTARPAPVTPTPRAAAAPTPPAPVPPSPAPAPAATDAVSDSKRSPIRILSTAPQPHSATAPSPRPSSPREQAEYAKHGTVGGVPAAPWHPAIKAREAANAVTLEERAAPSVPPLSWGALLKRS